jgi:hypothetical protein
MPHLYTLAYQARANTPFWQRCLRRSVRLYLALGEPDYNQLEVEAALRLIELEMSWYLLGDEHASAFAQAQVQGLLESAQAELLNNRAEIQALLREPLGAHYRVPPEQTSFLSQVSATGCGGTAAVRHLVQAYWAAA